MMECIDVSYLGKSEAKDGLSLKLLGNNFFFYYIAMYYNK